MDKKTFNEYLILRTFPTDIRFIAMMNVLFFSDLLGFLPLLGIPRLPFFINLAIIPVIILNIWLLVYIIAPYRFELSFTLFQGVWGVLTSFLYFLVTQKFLYNILHFETLLFFYLGLALYLISVSGVIIIQHLSINGKIKIPEGPGAWTKWIAIVPGFSYVFGQMIFSIIKSDDIKALIFVGCILGAMIFPILFVKLLHQYFFFIKNKDALLAKYPTLNKPKKERIFQKRPKNSKSHKRKKQSK
ncbi:hypothetical protein EV207_10381 [Scopulibacillus darangshiensis]|uniref:Uncharacterized protein n=1 Tax=Scopulibacillus darangshiensis TaxID=442528 RepID=A0A4R2PA13_9BACL|nr:hypothetical protein [Scopulibacillus darangshiensis]TCP31198.1 hypothetical protein EV207_10381 [Scopulibacillus darangshiensis]